MIEEKIINKQDAGNFFSILMSIYYGTPPEFLDDSLESVFNQTYKKYEIIIVIDGKLTEKHYEVISYWKKIFNSKLVEFRIKENVGLAAALNKGLHVCKYEWVSRMDADDIMRNDRLLVQNEFISENKNIDVVGSWIDEYDESMKIKTGTRKVPVDHQGIIKFGKWRCPMNHMSVCYKKSAVLDVGGYNEKLKRSQDYALWANLIVNEYKFYNIPLSLVKVRTGANFFSKRNNFKVIKYDIKQRLFMHHIGFLNKVEVFFSLLFRIMVRLMPSYIVKKLYKYLRMKKSKFDDIV